MRCKEGNFYLHDDWNFFFVMREKPFKIQERVGKVIVQETTPLLDFSKYLVKGGLSFALQLQGTARSAIRWSL